MAASSWIIPVILFIFGVLIGYFAKREKHLEKHLTDLEEDVRYFQDIPPGDILFLRQGGSRTKHVYIIEPADRENIYIRGEKREEGIIYSSFSIMKREDKYNITLYNK